MTMRLTCETAAAVEKDRQVTVGRSVYAAVGDNLALPLLSIQAMSGHNAASGVEMGIEHSNRYVVLPAASMACSDHVHEVRMMPRSRTTLANAAFFFPSTLYRT